MIPKVLTRNRFESLLRCMHCVDNEQIYRDKSSPLYDKISKIRVVLEHIVRRSQEQYNPDKFITCDEIMVAY
jgi:hypothetical protein